MEKPLVSIIILNWNKRELLSARAYGLAALGFILAIAALCLIVVTKRR